MKMKKISVMVLTAVMIMAAMASVGWAAAHNISVTAMTGGKATASATSAEAGDKITLTATPDSGYDFSGWTITPSSVDIEDPTNANTSFTMLDQNVTVRAKFTATSAVKYTSQVIIRANGAEREGKRSTAAAGSIMVAFVTGSERVTVTGWSSEPAGVEFYHPKDIERNNRIVYYEMPDHDVKIIAHVSGGSGSSSGSGGCSVGFGLAAIVGAALLFMKKR